jgi:spore coat protein U-like protein
MQALAGQYVSYGLYTGSAYSLAWTTTTSTTSCSGGTGTCALGTGTDASQPITVYAQIPPQNAPAPGNYADTVVVTVTF